MNFSIELTETYPHVLEKVWKALTDPDALAKWLMQNDFVPEQGADFTMWCEDGDGRTDKYICRLLEYELHKRMLWSWTLDGDQDTGMTFVELIIEATESGTRLTIIHSGDSDQETIDKFRGGWPGKLHELEHILAGW